MYSGIPIGDLTASDVMLDAVSQEMAIYWPMERELLASILEMLHVLVITTQAANGGKNLPKPMQIQRPQFDRIVSSPDPGPKGGAPVISMSEFVARDKRGSL